MRYLDGQEPDPDYAYTEGMHVMLTFSAGLSLIVGIVLLWLGIRGKVMWLKAWSVGLIICSIVYIVYNLIR